MSNILDKTSKEYIQSLTPKDIPDWRESLEEGRKIGEGIEIGVTPFMKKYGVKSDVEYRLRNAEKGILTWQINMGLATVEEEAAGLRKAEKFNEETGLCISYAHQLPRTIVGTPKELRDGIPTGLGFELNELEDWKKITTASTIQAVFADQHLGYPNSVFTTINSLKAGSMYQGMFGMFHQVAPGCPDEVWNMNEIVKSIGIVASKYDDRVVINSNADDSLPAYCVDLMSYLAWGKLEKYIVSDLCKARYAFSFGNLTSNLIHKAALWLAASDAFKLEDQPGIEFIYPNTIDHWDHHMHSNYGFQIPEALLATLLERKYKTGGSFLSVPISEKVSIPTVDEMLEMTSACQRTAECAEEFEQMMNWTVVEELRDKLEIMSEKMFNNILVGMEEAGVDITNPIQLMVVIKTMDPTKFEKLFHPSTANDKEEEIIPLMPAALWQQSSKLVESIVGELKNTEMAKKIVGHKVCVVSGDMHYFGLFVIVNVLKRLGAEVIDGGNSIDPIDALDIADEYGITDLCISLHNGQALYYGELIKKLASERGKEYRFFMGGVLTSFLNESDVEPSDVTNEINEMGIVTSTTIEELLIQLTKNM